VANEILYAGVADQRTAEILSGDYLMLIAARDALPQHPALAYLGDLKGRGSNVIKIPHLGLMGYDLPSQTADGAAVANTALSDGSTTVTVARYSKAYEQSDLAKFSDGLGVLDGSVWAADAAASHSLALTNAIANLVDGFATTETETGVDFNLTKWLSAIGKLEVNVQSAIAEGQAMVVFHTQQVADLRTAIATLAGGALQWYPPSQPQLTVAGAGYRGRFMGMDIFASGYVPTANAGADRAGGMFVRGAICWADMGVAGESNADQLVIGGKVLFERDRTAKAAATAYVSHSYFGVSEGIDLLGVTVVSDA